MTINLFYLLWYGRHFSLAYVWTKTTCCSNYYSYVTKWICRYIPINPEALKKPRNKRILYITFYSIIKTNHTDYRRCDSFFSFLFRFTNKNSMIENTTIIEHTIASQLLLYAVDALFLIIFLFLTTVKSSFFMRLK